MRWPTDNGAVRKGGTSSFRVHNERHANSCLGSSGVNANVPTSAPSSAFSGGFARVWTALCRRQTPCPMRAVGVTVTPHWINGILNTPALIWIRGRETVASPNKMKKPAVASRPGSTAAQAS